MASSNGRVENFATTTGFEVMWIKSEEAVKLYYRTLNSPSRRTLVDKESGIMHLPLFAISHERFGSYLCRV